MKEDPPSVVKSRIWRPNMLDFVKDIFSRAKVGSGESSARKTAHEVQIATCALFLEMAKIDDRFTDEEQEMILSILKDKYGLSRDDADMLEKEAEASLNNSVDLWQFANLINENYSIEEKLDIIELLWQLVFVDGKMNRYEDYLMHKLTNLLRLSDTQLINAKLKVMQKRSD